METNFELRKSDIPPIYHSSIEEMAKFLINLGKDCRYRSHLGNIYEEAWNEIEEYVRIRIREEIEKTSINANLLFEEEALQLLSKKFKTSAQLKEALREKFGIAFNPRRKYDIKQLRELYESVKDQTQSIDNSNS